MDSNQSGIMTDVEKLFKLYALLDHARDMAHDAAVNAKAFERAYLRKGLKPWDKENRDTQRELAQRYKLVAARIKGSIERFEPTVRHAEHGTFKATDRKFSVAPSGDTVKVEYIGGGKRITGASGEYVVTFETQGRKYRRVFRLNGKYHEFANQIFGV